jgi:hypothetical protein
VLHLRHGLAECVCNRFKFVCSAAAQPCKPNIILILVDDQDPDLNSTHPRYMPSLNKWFVEGGTQIVQHRINTPICCELIAVQQQQQQQQPPVKMLCLL